MVVLLCDVVGPVLVLDEADQPLERVVLELCAAREVALERLPDVRGLGSPRPGREPLERPLARVVEVDLLSTHTSEYTSRHPRSASSAASGTTRWISSNSTRSSRRT